MSSTAAPQGPEVPARKAHRIFNPAFLERLGQQFKFDGNDPEIAAAIIRMGISYYTLNREETSRDIKALRGQHNKLIREIKSLRKSLEMGEELALPELMYFAALRVKERHPNGDFPDLSEHERKHSGEPYFRELLRHLDILLAGLKENIRRSGLKRGRRGNDALDSLALKAGQFFARELKGRPFTIDPHKPFKPTKAFDFVKALVIPLNDAVTDDEIITAIRTAKGKLKKPWK